MHLFHRSWELPPPPWNVWEISVYAPGRKPAKSNLLYCDERNIIKQNNNRTHDSTECNHLRFQQSKFNYYRFVLCKTFNGSLNKCLHSKYSFFILKNFIWNTSKKSFFSQVFISIFLTFFSKMLTKRQF